LYYYHHRHGAFVTWEINLFLRRLHAEVTPLQVLSVLIAGAIHDVNHPGLSNAYLVATSSPLAIKYSDDSVLERMHLAEAFQACTKDGCNIFEGLSTDQRRQSRKLIVTMVLATDLSGHLKHVNKLKSKRYVALQSQSSCDLMAMDAVRSRTSSATGNSSALPPCLLEADDLVFQTIMMMADVGHETKAFGVHFAWSKLVSEEFFRQGDLERQFHMASISPLCDREHASKFEKSQVGFLEFVVLPLYAAARDVLPMQLDGVVDRIRANNAMWKRRAESVEKGLVPPPPDGEEEVSTTMGQSDSGSGMAQVREEDEGETETEDSERSRSGCSTRGEE
jgi:cAMP-specific phosphodiesterase 4